MTKKAFVPSPLLISGANPKSNVKSNMQNKPNSTALRAPRKRIHCKRRTKMKAGPHAHQSRKGFHCADAPHLRREEGGECHATQIGCKDDAVQSA